MKRRICFPIFNTFSLCERFLATLYFTSQTRNVISLWILTLADSMWHSANRAVLIRAKQTWMNLKWYMYHFVFCENMFIQILLTSGTWENNVHVIINNSMCKRFVLSFCSIQPYVNLCNAYQHLSVSFVDQTQQYIITSILIFLSGSYHLGACSQYL